ncbi:hypothetical protein MMC18_005614 [Xylographa bjoerkii]|nr:hypothetical protein [Xylographa bjoerkii]
MDPLSISASIVGLITAAVQISSLLKTFINHTKHASISAQSVLLEIRDIGVCLNQLQGFLLGTQEASKSRKSLIMVEQVVIVFTDCVSVFSDLEQTLEMIRSDQPTRIIDRMKWAAKESSIAKILLRLQASKASLNLMLTTLTCTSVHEAHVSVRTLASLVQQVLRSNLDMSRRLRNFERLHPAMAASISPSRESQIMVPDHDTMQGTRPPVLFGYAFEEVLWTSRVYKKTALNVSRFSASSCAGSLGHSYLSGLSLSDVSNVSAIALPILSEELWNHHRYNLAMETTISGPISVFDAWYNPPAKRSAFIRTAYFNGQYTNQYAQSKSTGHLVYRRFNVAGPRSSPAFVEGAVISQSHVAIAFEQRNAAVDNQAITPIEMSQKRCTGFGRSNTLSSYLPAHGWSQEVIGLLQGISY